MAEMQQGHRDGAGGQSTPLTHVINLIGAVTSLALVVGVAVWGYGMVMRDVSGVPVVRAAEGPMRVAPDDPGGRPALYQGLAVNAVLADGAADTPAERLILAPAPLDLTLPPTGADRHQAGPTPDAERDEVAAADAGEGVRRISVEALAESLADGVTPLADLPGDGTAGPDAAPVVTGGLGRSLRPRSRPAGLITSPEEVAMAAVVGATVRDVDPDTIPVGTRLAQLGAFGSREVALREWDKLAERFDEYLYDKARVIQKAASGGRSFYRLRALGFDDLSDARRFCSALVAENAECIPVITR